jgi:hypothetical protein
VIDKDTVGKESQYDELCHEKEKRKILFHDRIIIEEEGYLRV